MTNLFLLRLEIIKFFSYIFLIFIILGEVFNVNIAGLITGLGIGGIALAMASKESLENLLRFLYDIFR